MPTGVILPGAIGRLTASSGNAASDDKIPGYDTSSGKAVFFTVDQIASGANAVDGPASSTDNAIARFDSTTGKLLQDSSILISDTGVVTSVLSLGTIATGALVEGSGASGAEHELGSTAGTALNFRFRGSHTTGDMRGMYLRLDFDAASGSGEALRVFTEIENVDVAVGGTVNAIHATMEIDGDSGTVDGAGNVIRATLGGSGTKTMTGTLSGILVDMDLPSAVTLLGTEAAFRISKTQDHEWPVSIAFDSTVGAGNAIEAATSAMSTNATSHAMHITIDGVSGYIPVFDNKTWS